MNLILLGAPGAGKGTLASYLIEQMGVPSISTGNILREAIKNNTPLGQSAKEYMDAGKLAERSECPKGRSTREYILPLPLGEVAERSEDGEGNQ